jgi:hypothetical protein
VSDGTIAAAGKLVRFILRFDNSFWYLIYISVQFSLLLLYLLSISFSHSGSLQAQRSILDLRWQIYILAASSAFHRRAFPAALEALRNALFHIRADSNHAQMKQISHVYYNFAVLLYNEKREGTAAIQFAQSAFDLYAESVADGGEEPGELVKRQALVTMCQNTTYKVCEDAC